MAQLGPRATIAHPDVRVSPETRWTGAMEPHLFVPLPIGKPHKRNQYLHRCGEDFSTLKRTIMPKDEVVVGQYAVHVTTRLNRFNEIAEFALAASRSTDRSDLEFAIRDECGSCNEARWVSGICACKNAVRDMRQTRIMIMADSNQATCWLQRGGTRNPVSISDISARHVALELDGPAKRAGSSSPTLPGQHCCQIKQPKNECHLAQNQLQANP
jgi:hypothetical protein